MKTLTILIQTILFSNALSAAAPITCSPVSSELPIGAIPPITADGTYSTKGCRVTLDTVTGHVSNSCGITVIGINFYDIYAHITGAYRVNAESNIIRTPPSYVRCTAAMQPKFNRGTIDTAMMTCSRGSFKYIINDSASDIPICINRSPEGYDAVIARADEIPDGYASDFTRAIPVFPGVYAVCSGLGKTWHMDQVGTYECVSGINAK